VQGTYFSQSFLDYLIVTINFRIKKRKKVMAET